MSRRKKRGRGGRFRGRRGRGRGHRRFRGRGGRSRNQIRLSESSRVHLSNLTENDILTNHLPFSIQEDQRIQIYHYVYEREYHDPQKKYIARKIEEIMSNDPTRIIFSTNFFLSLDDTPEIFKPFLVLEKDEETEGEEDKEGNKELEKGKYYQVEGGREGFGVKFHLINRTYGELSGSELEMYLNIILTEILKRSRVLSTRYKLLADGRFVETHESQMARKDDRKRIQRIEDAIKIIRMKKTMRFNISRRKNGLYLDISPGKKPDFRWRNGWEVICTLRLSGWSDEKIREEMKKNLIVHQLLYRRGGQYLRVNDVLLDENCDSKIDFKPFNEKMYTKPEYTYREYVMENPRYRRELERKGVPNIEQGQPLLLCSGDNESSKVSFQKIIPQCVTFCPAAELSSQHSAPPPLGIDPASLPEQLNLITEILDLLSNSNELTDKLESFGFHIDFKKCLETCALNPIQPVHIEIPTNRQRPDQYSIPTDGSKWNTRMKNIRVHSSTAPSSHSFNQVMVIYTGGNRVKNVVNQLISHMKSLAQKNGMKNTHFDLHDCTRKGEKYIKELIDTHSPTEILGVPNIRDETSLYRQLYHICLQSGISIQFARAQNLISKKRILPVLASNLFHQLYTKKGGWLWDVQKMELYRAFGESSKNDILLIGVDCSRQTERRFFTSEYDPEKEHWVKSIKYYPSVYASVAVDLKRKWSRRYCSVLPEKDQEISSCSTINSLNYFLDEYIMGGEKGLPGAVVVFRDGVGISQMKELFDEEVESMKRVLERRGVLLAGYYLIQKRNRTLFFSEKRGGAPQPGSVTEKIVIGEEMFRSFFLTSVKKDFLMVSSMSERTAVRPNHYVELWGNDDVEVEVPQMVMELCCYYFNTCWPISQPFIVKMADRLARKMYRIVFELKRKGGKGKEKKKNREASRDGHDLKLRFPWKMVLPNGDMGEEMDGGQFQAFKDVVRICWNEKIDHGMFEL